jgi:hypothetical protein
MVQRGHHAPKPRVPRLLNFAHPTRAYGREGLVTNSPPRSECQTDFNDVGSRLKEVCAAERRQEIVQSYLIGQIVEGEGGGDPLVASIHNRWTVI